MVWKVSKYENHNSGGTLILLMTYSEIFPVCIIGQAQGNMIVHRFQLLLKIGKKQSDREKETERYR